MKMNFLAGHWIPDLKMLSSRQLLQKSIQTGWTRARFPGFEPRRSVSFLTPLGSAFNSRPSSKLNLMGEKFSQNKTGLFRFPGRQLWPLTRYTVNSVLLYLLLFSQGCNEHILSIYWRYCLWCLWPVQANIKTEKNIYQNVNKYWVRQLKSLR